MTQPERYSPELGLAFGAITVSFSAPIVRLLQTPPTVTAFYRMLFGGLILLVIVLSRRERPRFSSRALLLAGACGLAFACDLSLWHRCIRLVGPGLATLLVGLQVFFMAAFGLFFRHERISRRLVLGILLSVVGLALIVGVDWRTGGREYRLGVALGVLTALCYTTYLLFLRQLQGRADNAAQMANLSLLSLISAGFLGMFSLWQRESFAISGTGTAGLLVLYGIIGQVIAWVLMSRALPRIRTSIAGLLLLLQPTLSSVWDVIFFHRRVTAPELLGAALALGAIYLGATGGGKAGEPRALPISD